MQEFYDMEAAKEKLLHSFGIEKKEKFSQWDAFEFHNKKWCIWKDGINIRLFIEDDSSKNGFSFYQGINRDMNLLIKDNSNYVLYKTTWTEVGVSHSRYHILPKDKMVDKFEGIEVFLKHSKRPYQIMFNKGVENSCSLNRS